MKSWSCHKIKTSRSGAGAVAGAAAIPRVRAALTGIAAILSAVCPAIASASGYDVAAYVWPAYHNDPRWKELGIFADGKGEWQNLYESVKRTPDDYQGVKPLWGYEDESDPVVVARKIDAATAAGVNVFIYDWYWYGGRPFLEDALNKGFLGAKNCERMKFYIMWANHDVDNLWNNKIGGRSKRNVVWNARITDEDWRQMTDSWIERYFSRSNYYRIDGKPVLSIYSIRSFIDWDGVDRAKTRLEGLRERMKKAGFPGIHIQITGGVTASQLKEQLMRIGVDSVTNYSWNDGTFIRINDEKFPELEYHEWGEMALQMHGSFKNAANALGAEYFPNVTVGWDNNARYPSNETRRIVRHPSPAAFERFAGRVKDWADVNIGPSSPKLITVNSWNEWTEGTYLEPDDNFGYGYLDALRRVFVK